MPSLLLRAFVAVSALSIVSTAIPQVQANLPPSAYTEKGCFKSSEPLEDQGFEPFQTRGLCQGICAKLRKPVFALVDGSNCFCGDLLPPKEDEIDGAECDTPCQGYDLELCGGGGVFAAFLTGITKNKIDHFEPKKPPEDKPSDPEPPPPPQPSTVVVMVPSATPTHSKPKEKESPSKIGIAVGVVVGFLALAGVIGGIFFYLRYQKRREAEEAYKNAASVNSFIESGKIPGRSISSSNDSRLDPIAARRMSDGSIADNQDFSRRILQVTNPDYS